jgi:O-antigen/teichoic acid export membrane protein
VIPDPVVDPIQNQTTASERQTSDWDIRNAPRNYLWLLIAHGGTASFSFLSVWIITRYFGSEGYGGVVAFVAASQMIQIFVNWSSTALARFGIQEFVETGKITRSFWTRSLIFFPNLFLILLASGAWLLPLASWLKIPASAMWLIVVHIVATSVWLHIQYSLQGAKMLRVQGILLAAERGLTFLGLIMFVLAKSLYWENILWCYIVPPLLMSAVGVWLIRPYIELKGFYDAPQFRKMLLFSLPLIPFAIIGYLSTSQLDAVFITRYLSTRDLGIYAVAAQINGIAQQLPILANTILLSLFVSLKTSGKDSLVELFFAEVVPSMTLIWATVCGLGAFLCAILIPLVFGQEFGAAVQPLWILLSASVIVFPILTGFATLSNTYSKTYISMYASTFAAVANVVFNLFLIPRFGMIGCAWATVLSSLVSLSVFYGLLRREKLMTASWVFQAVVPAAASALVFSFDNTGLWPLVVFVSLGILVAYLQRASLKYTINNITGRFINA